jgi:hypothetical protein
VNLHAHGAWLFLALADELWVLRRGADGWGVVQELDYTPTHIAFDGDTLVLGKSDAWGRRENAGNVSVFTLEGGEFTLQQELTASDALPHVEPTPSGDTFINAQGRGFGKAVDVQGDTILVATSEKRAYHFQRAADGRGEEQEVFWASGTPRVFGDRIVVLDSEASRGRSPGAGVVTLFTRDSGRWQPLKRIVPKQRWQAFGSSMAVHQGALLIGAEGHRYAGSYWTSPQPGAVFLLDVDCE